MAKIADSITELIGATPIVALHKYENRLEFGGRLLAKLEYFNPTGSVKDRIAKEMIEAAEEKLKPGGTIIEATSGNTGIGLAAIGAAKGYRTIIVMPDNVSVERRKILKAYGAEVVLTPGKLNMGGANAKAAEILAATDNAVLTGQGGNPNNPAAHRKTTGPEIWKDTDGGVDILIATVGTGGTISGAGRYLKEKNPDIQVIGVEPAGCPVLSGGEPGPHKIQGIGSGSIAPVTDVELLDRVIAVTDDDAYDTARSAAKTEGLFIGISSGAVLWAAIETAKRPENAGKTIVMIFPDSGDRYLSTDLFDESSL
ncbi:MAG: cysteine synthase A [Eubacteriales bacterium]|nr:cysteine synthase A [Eubacteriales bacterium]